jgi:DNA recombination protein RmuC
MTSLEWTLAAGLGAAVATLASALVLFVRAERRAREAAENRGPDPAMALLQQQLESLRGQLSQSLAESLRSVQDQVATSITHVNERLRENSETLAKANQTLGERLDNAAKVVGGVQKQLGTLDEATRRVFEVGRDISSLQDILRSPKLRGGLGEFFLGDLLAQILPVDHFELQHGFKSGERVDAVIRLGDALVPVDAKFPLEDLRRVLDAENDADRLKARRQFVVRVKKHVDAIAQKYILPDEGTYDFALMYVPAENVYYETIIRGPDGEDEALQSYALAKRVIPVSPGSFYAYLQAILLGLKGLRVEERARQILDGLSRLESDVERCREDFRLLGKHLGNATSCYAAAEKRLDRLSERVATIHADERPVPLAIVAESGGKRD